MKITYKKPLICVLILAALLSFAFTVNAAEAQEAIITNTAIEAKPDETVTTTLVLAVGSNATSFNFWVTYDTENLTLLSVKQNSGCEGTLVMNSATPGRISFGFSAAENIGNEMPFVDLQFSIDGNIGVGNYPIVALDTSRPANAFTFEGNTDKEIPLIANFTNFYIYEAGDVSLDGRILSNDATFILRYLVELMDLSPVQLYYADAYADGIVNVFDATWILRHIVGYDVQLGNRVNITFYRMDGSVYATKSVAFGEDLIKLPAVPDEDGYANGCWSMSADEFIEVDLRNIENAVNVYPIYEEEESAAMKFYKERLTEQYYLDPTHVLPSTDLRLINVLTYQLGRHAVIYWSTDKSAIFNATTGAYSQPNYDQEVILYATILAYNGDAIEGQAVLPFLFTANGKFPTPTKAEIANYLATVIGDKINYNMLLPQKVTNREVQKQNPYEVRVEWEMVNYDGSRQPAVQLERKTTSQDVNLVATLTFNGVPLEDDGKVYFDNVTLTAITEAEIRQHIIKKIATNMGLTLTTGESLWNDDDVFNTSITWISKNIEIATIAANTVTVRPIAMNGESFPMEAQVTYETDNTAKTFNIAYTVSVVNENTLLVPGMNIQQPLYDAFRDALNVHGNITVEHLRTPTFVYLDLSKYPDITDLSGLTYCKNLRVLNISGLQIERALNEISTLSRLEALMARNCGIDNLTDGGIPVLKTAINLKLLDLSHNNFTSLNSVLADNVTYAKLQEVYLNDNQLTDISALKRAPILYFLALSNNGLDSNDIENLSSFRYLRYLSLADNKITSITPLRNLTNLMELRLQNNQITNVRDLQLLNNLWALYLGDNQISDVTWLNNLRLLQVLYLNNNNLTDINSLDTLNKLVALNVSGNRLQNLNMLSACKATMKELYAENNDIRSFSFLSGMTNLQRLMLSGNANTVESSLVGNLATLTKLQTLTLSGKPLTTGLGFLGNINNLTRLDVANCNLPNGSDTQLPSSLRYLDISNNTNLIIDSSKTDGIYELDKLIGLYADNMQGSVNPEQLFALMSDLQYVSLENCGIEEIGWLLSRLYKLIYVDLAGNPIKQVNFNSISNSLKKELKYLILDAETTPTFADAYYAYNGIGEVPLEIVSLAGSQIGSMTKLPFLDRVRHLDLSNSGITNLRGENPDLVELYSIERYEIVEALDLSGLQANIAPVENLQKLNTLYAVGTSSDKIFYRDNILSLYRLYNNGVTAYLYSKDEAYEPVAQREGTEILSELPDISQTVQVAADNIFSDNNPTLAAIINDFPITWTVSNPVNYEIVNGKLSVKSYTNLVDEELTLTAKISVYPNQADVTREFKIQTDILRTLEKYVTRIEPGKQYMRSAEFVYDVTVHAAETEGFSNPVKPVYSEIKYTYSGTQPWTQILTESAGHNYKVNSDAVLGATVNIFVSIGHSDPNLGFVSDWQNNDGAGTHIEIVAHTANLTYYLNEGIAPGIQNGNPIPTAEETVIANFIPERLGYLFEGWFRDAAFTLPFIAPGSMPSTNLQLYAKWKAHSYTVTFNPNGGTVSPTSKMVLCDTAYGDLPTPTRTYYDFLGWFTAASGGTKIIATTIASSISSDQTLFAQWQRRTFTLNYNANGGTVSPANKTVNCGDTYGTLPTPTRDYYQFLGWFTAASGGTQVTSSTASDNTTTAKTIYAQWKLKDVTDWVLASQMPADAQKVSQKWRYTHTQTSTSSTLPSNYYYVSTAYGAWPAWPTTWQRTSIAKQYNPYHPNDNNHLLRDVETKSVAAVGHTEYHYFRWYKTGYMYTYKPDNTYKLEEAWFTWELGPTPKYGASSDIRSTNSSNTVSTWWCKANSAMNYSTDKTWTRWVVDDPAHTEYRSRTRTATYSYRRDNIEVTSNPSGGSGVSNVVEYVQYRPK